MLTSQLYSESEVKAAINLLEDTQSIIFMNVAELINRLLTEIKLLREQSA